jgi:thioredoxin reductase (NADPH)
MEQMRLQAERVGTRLVSDYIVGADLSKTPFHLLGDSGTAYTCDALVVATGAKARWLGIPSEEKYKGYGVSACATCDGFFYRNHAVVVVGGGNSAVEEALYLANIASKVTVIHRRNAFRAERIMQDRLLEHPKIEVIWNHAVEEICGSGNPPSVTHVRVKDVQSGDVRDLSARGIFIAIGHSPASDLFAGQIDMKPNNYIKTLPGSTKTNVAGVFAAGDVADDQYRQAITAAGLGCMAALEAEHWLATRTG